MADVFTKRKRSEVMARVRSPKGNGRPRNCCGGFGGHSALDGGAGGEESPSMKREGQLAAQERGTRRSRHRRGRGLKKILLGSPSEVSADYPGFFVLPRASSSTPATPGRHPTWRVWWSRCKLTAVLALLLGGFIGTLAYFFVQITPELAEPYPVAAPFVSDPKLLPTNSDAGLGRR